jgi:hypothetical protein
LSAKATGTTNSSASIGLTCCAVKTQNAPKAPATSISPLARFMMRATPYCSVSPIASSE